jgi:hypothetical protein
MASMGSPNLPPSATTKQEWITWIILDLSGIKRMIRSRSSSVFAASATVIMSPSGLLTNSSVALLCFFEFLDPRFVLE